MKLVLQTVFDCLVFFLIYFNQINVRFQWLLFRGPVGQMVNHESMAMQRSVSSDSILYLIFCMIVLFYNELNIL